MALNRISFVAMAMILLLPTIAFATEHIVGDESGWKLGVNYTAWAEGKMINVGDTLVFKYGHDDNVYKCNGTEFKECLIPPNTDPLTSGNDSILLESAGNKWYICGAKDHCAKGQKLKITVMDMSAPVPSPNAAVRGTNILSAFQVFIASIAMIVALN